jgi:hypothetical protein
MEKKRLMPWLVSWLGAEIERRVTALLFSAVSAAHSARAAFTGDLP